MDPSLRRNRRVADPFIKGYRAGLYWFKYHMTLDIRRIITSVALVTALGGGGRAAEPIFTTDVPQRVTEYTSRVYQCLDTGRQLNSVIGDPERTAILTRTIQALDCKNLHQEAAYLQREYNDYSPAAEAVQVATRDWQNSLRYEK